MLRFALSLGVVLAAPLLLSACDAMDPEQRRQALHLPPQGFKGDAFKGREAFNNYCVACHGRSGQGTDQGPPLVDAIYRPGHHADLAFHRAVKDGVKSHHWQFGDMQPIADITPEDTEHIIAYLRRRQRSAGIR